MVEPVGNRCPICGGRVETTIDVLSDDGGNEIIVFESVCENGHAWREMVNPRELVGEAVEAMTLSEVLEAVTSSPSPETPAELREAARRAVLEDPEIRRFVKEVLLGELRELADPARVEEIETWLAEAETGEAVEDSSA